MSRLTAKAHQAWVQFMDQSSNRGHATRGLTGPTLATHVASCRASARLSVARIVTRRGHGECRRILEIGCSTGINCLVLAEHFPDAEIIGIEPEGPAILVAQAMAEGNPAITFIQGVGERLPLSDASVDIVVCHTVIEHVSDVHQCLREMVRVLAPGGILSIEAPNYRFPREPHLGIWCLPSLGKSFVRFCAQLQNKENQCWFLDHLKFVTTAQVTRALRQLGCSVTDESRSKLLLLASGALDAEPDNARAGKWLKLLSRLGLGHVVIKVISIFKLYPSMLLTARPISSRAPTT